MTPVSYARTATVMKHTILMTSNALAMWKPVVHNRRVRHSNLLKLTVSSSEELPTTTISRPTTDGTVTVAVRGTTMCVTVRRRPRLSDCVFLTRLELMDRMVLCMTLVRHVLEPSDNANVFVI